MLFGSEPSVSSLTSALSARLSAIVMCLVSFVLDFFHCARLYVLECASFMCVSVSAIHLWAFTVQIIEHVFQLLCLLFFFFGWESEEVGCLRNNCFFSSSSFLYFLIVFRDLLSQSIVVVD